jgi:hypothetical protein
MEPQRPHHHAEPDVKQDSPCGADLVPDPPERTFPPGFHHPPTPDPIGWSLDPLEPAKTPVPQDRRNASECACPRAGTFAYNHV